MISDCASSRLFRIRCSSSSLSSGRPHLLLFLQNMAPRIFFVLWLLKQQLSAAFLNSKSFSTVPFVHVSTK